MHPSCRHRRRLDVTTLAGSVAIGSADGTGTAASFEEPHDVAVSPDGMTVYVAGHSDNRIRQVTT